MSGGAGNDGDGGNGGYLDMEAGEVSLHNSGAITVRGGNGTVNGGTGGSVNMYVYSIGDLLNSGAIDASGGALSFDVSGEFALLKDLTLAIDYKHKATQSLDGTNGTLWDNRGSLHIQAHLAPEDPRRPRLSLPRSKQPEKPSASHGESNGAR